MNLYQSDSNVGDYIVLDGTPFYYADWDVQDIYFKTISDDQVDAESHNWTYTCLLYTSQQIAVIHAIVTRSRLLVIHRTGIELSLIHISLS